MNSKAARIDAARARANPVPVPPPAAPPALDKLGLGMMRVPNKQELHGFRFCFIQAALLFLLISGVHHAYKEVPGSPGEVESMLEKQWDELLGSPVSVETTSRCIQQFERRVDHARPMDSCASCGIRRFQGGGLGSEGGYFQLVKLSKLGVLEVTGDSLREYNELPEEYRPAWNVYEADNGTLYYLHPELVQKRAPARVSHSGNARVDSCGVEAQFDAGITREEPMVPLCATCSLSIFGKREVPSLSIAGGYHFGSPARLRLQPLTTLERIALSPVRIYSTIVKISPYYSVDAGAKQRRLKSHVITFVHDCPQRITDLGQLLDDVATVVSIQFVGPKGKWEKLNKHLFVEDFTIRPAVLLQWIHALQALNSFYKDVVVVDTPELRLQMEQLGRRLLDRAVIIDDDTAVAVDGHMGHAIPPYKRAAADDMDDGVHVDNGAAEQLHIENVFVMPAGRMSGDSKSQIDAVYTAIQDLMRGDNTDASLDAGAHANRNQTSPATTGEQPTRPSVTTVTATRSIDPVNMYTEFSHAVMGSFVNVFFLGKGLPATSKGLTMNERQLLLHQFDTRFEKDAQLLFVLTNHEVLRISASAVNAELKCHPDAFEELVEFYHDPNSLALLREAKEDHKGTAAKTIMSGIGKYITTCGRKVPYSPMERQCATAEMYAMVSYFGMPTMFITVAPDDSQSPLMLRLSFPTTDAHDFPSVVEKDFFDAIHDDSRTTQYKVDIPLTDQRLMVLLAQNPVAAAKVFRMTLEALFEELIGIRPVYLSKATDPNQLERDGVFGKARAFYAVLEAQCRGSLHCHFVLWTCLTPEMMQKVATQPGLARRVAAILDSILTAELDPVTHLNSITKRRKADIDRARWLLEARATRAAGTSSGGANGTVVPTTTPLPPLPPGPIRPSRTMCGVDPITHPEEYKRKWIEGAESNQLHCRHTETCLPKHDSKREPGQPTRCRLDKPSVLVEETCVRQLSKTPCLDENGKRKRRDDVNVMEDIDEEDRATRQDRDYTLLPVALPDNRCLCWELQRRVIPQEVFDDIKANPDKYNLPEETRRELESMPAEDWALMKQLLSTRNGEVTEFNKPIAAVHCYSQASLLLGAIEQATCAMWYMGGYLSKNPLKPEVMLPLLVEAYLHTKSFESRAPDAETDPDYRDVCRLIQRYINAGVKLAEMSDQQAAAFLLGLPANIASHRFVYLFLVPALAFVTSSRTGRGRRSRATGAPEQPLNSTRGDKAGEAGPAGASGGTGTDGPARTSSAAASGRGSAGDGNPLQRSTLDDTIREIADTVFPVDPASVGRVPLWTVKGEPGQVPVPQHYNYALRGPTLAWMPLYVYCAVVKVEPLSKLGQTARARLDGDEPEEEGHRKPGPQANAVARFDPRHKLYDTHVQYLPDLLRIPEIIGQVKYPGPPPQSPEPGSLPSEAYNRWSAASKQYAQTMMTLFRPWDFDTDGETEFTWEALSAFMESLRTNPTFWNQSINQLIHNVTYAMECSEENRFMLRTHRAENAHVVTATSLRNQGPHWPSLKALKTTYASDANGGGDDGDQRGGPGDGGSAQDAIDKVIDEIQKRHGTHEGDHGGSKAYDALEQSILWTRADLKRIFAPLLAQRDGHERTTNGGAPAGSAPFGHPVVHPGLASEVQDMVRSLAAMPSDRDKMFLINPDVTDVRGSGAGAMAGSREVEQPQLKLNEDQTAIVDLVKNHVLKMRNKQPVRPLLLLLLGGPGVGKTATIKRIVQELEEIGSGAVCVAYTGVAAAEMPNGRTLCAAFHVDAYRRRPLTSDQKAELKAVFGGKDVLIIDEASMLPVNSVAEVCDKMQGVTGVADEPFGGKIVILCGDPFQLPPVKGMSCMKAVMSFLAPELVYTTKRELNDALKRRENHEFSRGVELFQQFELVELTKQMRSVDPEHSAVVEQIRNLAAHNPVTQDVLNHVQQRVLTTEDVQRDAKWLTRVPIITDLNSRREAINSHQAVAFAVFNDRVVITWRKQLKAHKCNDDINEEDLEEMYEHPCALDWFVQGGPAFLVERNIRPEKGLANGTPCTLHSLCFRDEAARAEAEALVAQAKGGDVVRLPQPPVSVNVRPTLPKHQQQWAENSTLVRGEVVIPIPVTSAAQAAAAKANSGTDAMYGSRKQTHGKVSGDVGGSTGKRPEKCVELRLRSGVMIYPLFETSGYALAFCITYYKAQSKTFADGVVLDLNSAPSLPSFLVGISRPTTGANLRMLPLAPGKSLNGLLSLQHDRSVVAWKAGFGATDEKSLDPSGPRRWNAETAKAVLKEQRAMVDAASGSKSKKSSGKRVDATPQAVAQRTPLAQESPLTVTRPPSTSRSGHQSTKSRNSRAKQREVYKTAATAPSSTEPPAQLVTVTPKRSTARPTMELDTPAARLPLDSPGLSILNEQRPLAPRGLPNRGNICFMLTALQTLFAAPAVVAMFGDRDAIVERLREAHKSRGEWGWPEEDDSDTETVTLRREDLVLGAVTITFDNLRRACLGEDPADPMQTRVLNELRRTATRGRDPTSIESRDILLQRLMEAVGGRAPVFQRPLSAEMQGRYGFTAGWPQDDALAYFRTLLRLLHKELDDTCDVQQQVQCFGPGTTIPAVQEAVRGAVTYQSREKTPIWYTFKVSVIK